mmetsp:Transcript_388/g.879  ORF Transcript_388/g.879 Transcript_388/m.879 type:complete len:243 (-) Transcript_388:1033-1761(-)
MRVYRRRGDHLPVIVNRLHEDLIFGHCEVIEAILSLSIPLGTVVAWGCLRADSSTTTSDDASKTSEHARVGPQLLVVTVPRDEQIQARVPQLSVPVGLVPTRKVRVHDLPIGPGGCHLRFQPHALLLHQALEIPGTSLDGWRTSGRGTTGPCSVVLSAADVVLRVLVGLEGIFDIAIDVEDVHVETCILEGDMHAPIGCRHHPPGTGPCVGNLLIPTIVEDAAAPVVIAQHAQPKLAIQAAA